MADNIHVSNSAKESKYLQEFGAKAVDLRLVLGISYDILKQAADEVGLWITDEGAYNTHFLLVSDFPRPCRFPVT